VNLFRSIIFNFVIYLIIILSCIVALPMLALPRKAYLSKLSNILGKLFIFFTQTILNTKVTFVGLEKIPKDRKFFIASAHQSMFETFVYNTVIPDCIFVIKKELLSIPLYGLYLKKLDYVSIDRGKTTKSNLNFFDNIFSNIKNTDRTLIIFPQGTRVKYGEMPPLKKGTSRIYQSLNIPCLPIKLNTGSVWPKNSFLKYPGEIIFEIKDLIEPGLNNVQFTEALEKAIYN
jgi:1-acyl-sn-glycerol-3-phosphate acyltransferase